MAKIENNYNFETDKIQEHILTLKDGDSIEVKEIEPGVFDVIKYNIADNKGSDPLATSRGFIGWDKDVENLDKDSDVYKVLGLSQDLKWKDVELTPYEIKSPSLERLKEALQHVSIDVFCPDDI